jgi:hypothetical protein
MVFKPGFPFRHLGRHSVYTQVGIAKLYRKGGGQEAKLSYLGHVLLKNRNRLIVDAMLTEA